MIAKLPGADVKALDKRYGKLTAGSARQRGRASCWQHGQAGLAFARPRRALARLLDRTDCPWYPSARLFRPRGEGDWDYAFDAASVELMARAKLV